MSISANSRYANSTIVAATDLDNHDIRAITFAEPEDTVIRFTYYQVKGNDFIDLIANRFYGDPLLWWVIAKANPEILDFSMLPRGYYLRIPGLNGLV